MARYVLKRLHASKMKDDFFSKRELSVLQSIADGKTQKEIASDLGLSPKTIDFHLGKIYKKLGVHNAPSAVAKAYEMGSLPM